MKKKPPLTLRKANIHRPSGPKNRGRFELLDGKKVIGKSEHSQVNDNSIQGSAKSILSIARNLKRKIKTKGGVIDPADENEDGTNSELI